MGNRKKSTWRLTPFSGVATASNRRQKDITLFMSVVGINSLQLARL